MTDTDTTDLTAPEAVERMARLLERGRGDVSATLRALSAALEAEKNHKRVIAGDKIDAVSELRQVKARLKEAVELLDSAKTVMQFVLDHEASELDRRLTVKDAMSSQKEIRAFLASMEDKP